MKMLCAGLFPALQRTLSLDVLESGAVNRVRHVIETVGGKAVNTARVLNTLGADPILLGFAGGDNRITVERLLDAERITHRFVQTDAPVRLAQTLLVAKASDFTELVEEGPVPEPGDWRRFLATFSALQRENIAGMVISGTLPAHAPVTIYAQMLASASLSYPVILDTAGPALTAALRYRPTLVKINAAELFLTVGMKDADTDNEADIQTAARRLIEGGAMAVGVTRGARDAWLITGPHAQRFTLPVVNVISTLGCGDAVNAGIAFALRQHRGLEAAFAFGLACGVSNAMHRLPGMVDPAQTDTIAARIIVKPHPSVKRSAASPPV